MGYSSDFGGIGLCILQGYMITILTNISSIITSIYSVVNWHGVLLSSAVYGSNVLHVPRRTFEKRKSKFATASISGLPWRNISWT